jgi:UDP-N-acetylmuramate dehydrogenase
MLQSLVDATIDAGLHGIETMTGIPGWVGGAIYGNAGA